MMESATSTLHTSSDSPDVEKLDHVLDHSHGGGEVAWDPLRHDWEPADEVSTVLGTISPKFKSEESIPIYVEWEENDLENPLYWSRRRKWKTTLICCSFTALVAAVGSSYAMGQKDMMRDLGASEVLVILGLSSYPLGFGLTPLLTASFSEITGRYRLYVVSIVLYTLLFIPTALISNIWAIIVVRFLSGFAGSTGSTLVGGTISDLFPSISRGFPMSLFAFLAFCGTSSGPIFAGFVAETIGWRWIQWIQGILSIFMTALIIFGTEETRGSIILSRRAKRLRSELQDERYLCRSDSERTSLWVAIRISVSRPLYLLVTEMIVAIFSLYAAFFWGITYLALEAVGIVFDRYHFSQGEIGLVFFTLTLGGAIGFGGNFYQEVLYKRHVLKRGPEARLYSSFVGAPLLAIGLLIFAFASNPSTSSAAGPIFGLTIAFVGVFCLYLAVFNYMADCYGIYASSALAGQSLSRNVAGFAFPLFTPAMYAQLSVQWASFLAAMLALVLGLIPFVLFFYGPQIRQRSKFAMAATKATQ